MNLDKLSAQIERMTTRVAQARTRKMLWEMRQQTEARERARRLDTRRRFALGTAVEQAGLADWEPTEIIGILLDGRDRAGTSPTMRLGFRKRGAEALALVTKTKPGKSAQPRDQVSVAERSPMPDAGDTVH